MELVENWSGSGPWSLVSWDEGVSYEFEANSNYFKEGRPFFGGIQGFQIVDIGTEIAAYKTERVLMPFDTNMQMGIADHKRLEQDEEFTSRFDLYFLKGTAHQGIQLNGSKPPFDKPEARRALFLALDRWEFIEGLGLGEWPLGTAMSQKNPYALPEDEVKQLPGYRRNPDGSKPQEDIDEAIRLLNSIGYTDDNPMKFEFIGASHSWLADGAQIAKNQWQDRFGLPVEITIVGGEIGAVVGQAIEGDYHGAVIGCGISIFDPDDSFYLCYMATGRNWTRVVEPGSEELFFAQQVEADPVKRRDINYELQRLVYAGAPGNLEIMNSAWGNWVHKRIRTENGPWQNRLSNYSHMKHEHEWLIPKDVWEAQMEG
jgi:ABC-type transport system substrate-binding protein